MTLQRISIGGYKAYPQKVDIFLKPVTLLYGQNSTGKSSLMRLLPILHETIKNPTNSPLSLSAALTKSANLSDLFSAYRDDGVIELTLQFDEDGGAAITTLEYKFRRLEREVVLLEFSLAHPKHSINVELDLSVLSGAGNGDVLRYVDCETKEEIAGLRFDGIVPQVVGANNFTGATALFAASLLEGISCSWLAPIRSGVPRISRVRQNLSSIGAFGEGCVDLLYEDFMSSGHIFSDVSAWFENNCASSLQIVPGAHEFGALAGLALVRQGDIPVRIPLEDCGEGISQVLPVLVLIALAKHGRLGTNPVVILEHPDLHLHSNAHYDIIRAIVDATKSTFKPRFLIESHAESVLVATQLHVVGGQLASTDVCAIHVKETRQGSSSADLIQFDSTGTVLGDFAAMDWFEQTNTRTLKLAKDMVGLP